MGSKADFYLGRGVEAEWLGSIEWDGYPAGLPTTFRTAITLGDYRAEIDSILDTRPDAIKAVDGWPWKWDSSHGTNYSYAFDTDRVWACCYGSSWWLASLREPDHTTLKRKAASLPDMSLRAKMDKPEGIFIKPK